MIGMGPLTFHPASMTAWDRSGGLGGQRTGLATPFLDVLGTNCHWPISIERDMCSEPFGEGLFIDLTC